MNDAWQTMAQHLVLAEGERDEARAALVAEREAHAATRGDADYARKAYRTAIGRADAAEAKLVAFTDATRRRGPLRILLGTAHLQAVNNNRELATTVLDLVEHIYRLIGPVLEAFEDGGEHG